MLTIQQKIEMACTVAEINKTELAKKLGISQPAFSQRLKNGKFSDEDFQNIAKALGAEYFSGFVFPNGLEIKQHLYRASAILMQYNIMKNL